MDYQKGKNNPVYGTRNKTRAQPVLMFTLDGEFIRRFDSIADANEFMGKNRYALNIYNCVRGTNGQKTAWGYRWTYDMED